MIPRVILYEGPGSEPLPVAERAGLLRLLLERGYAVSCVRDSLPAESRDSAMAVLARGNAPFPSIDLTEDRSAEQTLAALEAIRNQMQISPVGAHKPWFPVIDFSRCTNCMQCLSFCLFDVYGVSTEGKIEVRNQNNCKTDCPACSRVCPDVAIMFPKYQHSPINGEQISADDVRREAMKVDISALLGGDIYQALRDRSAKAKSRFSKERDDERALKERQNCLLKLKDLDIPPEVLASLPSPDEIRAKAEAAMARAQEAMATRK